MCLLALTFPVFHSSRFLVRRRYKYSMPSLVPKGCKVLEAGIGWWFSEISIALVSYCGWKKSCTTLDGWNPMNNGINHLSGAGFRNHPTASPGFRPPRASRWPSNGWRFAAHRWDLTRGMCLNVPDVSWKNRQHDALVKVPSAFG